MAHQAITRESHIATSELVTSSQAAAASTFSPVVDTVVESTIAAATAAVGSESNRASFKS